MALLRNRRGWWATRTPREQKLLLALGAVLLFVLVWLLVIRPIADARAAAEARLNAAAAELAQARGEALAIGRNSGAPGNAPVPRPLDGFLMTAGAEAGFSNMQVIGDGPDRATLTVSAARPQAFFSWIGQLEGRGLVIESMSARPGGNQTITAEVVMRARNG